MALPYLLFFHLLLQNELPQTGLNLQTRILIRVTQLSKAFGKTDVLHLILTVFVDGEATRPTLLRCSSWSSFLFKASSSSSSLDLLLPSEPTGSKHKPKKNRWTKACVWKVTKTCPCRIPCFKHSWIVRPHSMFHSHFKRRQKENRYGRLVWAPSREKYTQ